MKARPSRTVSIGATPVNIRKSPTYAPTFLDANVNTGTDVITITGHSFITGDPVFLSNSGGALPAGLAANTPYWIIWVSANTFKLAASLANAVAASPTAVDITAAAGGGTNTVSRDQSDPGLLPVTYSVIRYATGGGTVSLVPFAGSVIADGQAVDAGADFNDADQSINRYAIASAGTISVTVTDYSA